MPYSLPGTAEDVDQDKKSKKVEKANKEHTAVNTEKTQGTKLADSSQTTVETTSASVGQTVEGLKDGHEEPPETVGAALQKDLPIHESSQLESVANDADPGQSDEVDQGQNSAQDEWDAAMAAEEEGNQWLYSCIMCGDGGDVVMCEACPRVYHIDCLGQARVGRGGWCVTGSCAKTIVLRLTCASRRQALPSVCESFTDADTQKAASAHRGGRSSRPVGGDRESLSDTACWVGLFVY